MQLPVRSLKATVTPAKIATPQMHDAFPTPGCDDFVDAALSRNTFLKKAVVIAEQLLLQPPVRSRKSAAVPSEIVAPETCVKVWGSG